MFSFSQNLFGVHTTCFEIFANFLMKIFKIFRDFRAAVINFLRFYTGILVLAAFFSLLRGFRDGLGQCRVDQQAMNSSSTNTCAKNNLQITVVTVKVSREKYFMSI